MRARTSPSPAGIRYDWQNFFHANKDFSPRAAFAYAPWKNRKTVLRGGAGFFYDRTGPGPIFDLERHNGVRVQQIRQIESSGHLQSDALELSAARSRATSMA